MATAHRPVHLVAGSVTRSGLPTAPRPLNADHIQFSASATAPFWARQHTRLFLGRCGFDPETIQTAQMVVSELTTNAIQATGSHPGLPGVIGLSIRRFPDGLLIEVIDECPEPPVIVEPDTQSEHGRGIWIVAALSREWGYFPVRGGKCVYSILEIAG